MKPRRRVHERKVGEAASVILVFWMARRSTSSITSSSEAPRVQFTSPLLSWSDETLMVAMHVMAAATPPEAQGHLGRTNLEVELAAQLVEVVLVAWVPDAALHSAGRDRDGAALSLLWRDAIAGFDQEILWPNASASSAAEPVLHVEEVQAGRLGTSWLWEPADSERHKAVVAELAPLEVDEEAHPVLVAEHLRPSALSLIPSLSMVAKKSSLCSRVRLLLVERDDQ